MVTINDISMAVISLIRVGAVFRFIYCMVRLEGAVEEQVQYRKRAKNTVLCMETASIFPIPTAPSAGGDWD